MQDEEMDEEDNSEQALPDLLTDFGIVTKIRQLNKLEEEKEVPYWASSHMYDPSAQKWGETSIRLQEFKQSGNTHYFGVIELGMADALCRVPSLPESTDTLEIARRTIENEITEQYQRPIEFDRIDNISDFLKGSPTIVNPIILHIPESSKQNGSVLIETRPNGESIMNINLKKIPYMLRKCVDVDPITGKDYRPIDLVDGQHRVRASRTDMKSVAVTVPFVLIDEKMNGDDAGRIFAEINVQHDKLKELHELHLRYVLKLSSHISSQDFGEVSEELLESGEITEIRTMKQRYANRMAYRIGANLTFEKTSPLYTLIRFFNNHKHKPEAVDAKDWVEYAGKWILQQYGPEWDIVKVQRMIQCYFEAWKKTVNINPKTGEIYEDVNTADRWGFVKNTATKRENESFVFKKASFKAIMSLFPMCVQLSKAEEIDSEQDLVSAFLKVLTPCQTIDFGDLEIWKNRIFGMGANIGEIESHLYHWMAWAVREFALTGISVDADEAWNTDEGIDIDSAPGRGFFSGVNTSYFRGVLRVEDLYSSTEIDGMKITVEAEPIPNESRAKTISIQYRDCNGKIRPINKISGKFKGPSKSVGYNYFSQTMGTGPDLNGVSELIITVTSGNLFGEQTYLFRQEYTVNELQQLNGRVIYISSQKRDVEQSSGGIEFTEIPLSTESDFEHYDVEIPEIDEDEEDEGESKYNFSDNILPKNSFFPLFIRDRTILCDDCFHGRDHKCGYNSFN